MLVFVPQTKRQMLISLCVFQVSSSLFISIQLLVLLKTSQAEILEKMVYDKLIETGFTDVKVVTSFDVQWNSNMISEKGLAALKKHGLAPPPKHDGYIELDVLSDTPCPLCNSRNTTLKTPFGPTLCRSMHYCNNCKNAFEGFKPVG